MVTVFQQKLAEGQTCEHDTLMLMCHIGFIQVPLSKIEDFKDKGPRLYIPNPQSRYPILLPIPDLLCIRLHSWLKKYDFLPDEFFLEVKKKNKASYYRINSAWQSGIDKRYWIKYLKAEELTRKPVWISHLIYPTTEEAMNTQRVPQKHRPAPTGLFVHPVTLTPAFDPNHNPAMIYWKVEAMHKIAELAEVLAV